MWWPVAIGIIKDPKSILPTLILLHGPGWLSRYSDKLRAGRSGDRIPAWGEIFRIRRDRPWGPTQPLVQWVPCISRRGKAAGAWCCPSTHISAPKSWKGRATPSGPQWPVIGRTVMLLQCVQFDGWRGAAHQECFTGRGGVVTLGLYI